jgi:hypothetical protein
LHSLEIAARSYRQALLIQEIPVGHDRDRSGNIDFVAPVIFDDASSKLGAQKDLWEWF